MLDHPWIHLHETKATKQPVPDTVSLPDAQASAAQLQLPLAVQAVIEQLPQNEKLPAIDNMPAVPAFRKSASMVASISQVSLHNPSFTPYRPAASGILPCADDIALMYMARGLLMDSCQDSDRARRVPCEHVVGCYKHRGFQQVMHAAG